MRKLAVGVDIGGTNTVFGLVDRQGEMYGEGSISTTKHGSNHLAFLDELTASIKALASKLNDIELVGIGIGAPNSNYYTGFINYTVNLPWTEQINIVQEMSQRLSIPAILTNDANAAAIGEMMYGGAQGMKNFIVVTLGTGLGSGIVVDGKVVYGACGNAGELGHVTVRINGRDCGCGRKGCLETYVSATGIKRTAYKLIADSTLPSHLRSIPFDELDSRKIAEEADKGDLLAIEAFNYTGDILGRALADAVAFTSPEAIFLFGGLAKAFDNIAEPTIKSLNDNILYVYKDKVKILPSQIDDKNSAVLGSSALIWQELEK